MRVLAFDLGLNVGWALLTGEGKPLAGSFRIDRSAQDLGGIMVDFEPRAAELLAEHKPDIVARAARFISKTSNPLAIGPYFGLSMVLDGMATKRRLRHVELQESKARSAFLSGKVPRKSKEIKAAIMRACFDRGWWAADEHGCDAQCVAAYVHAHTSPKEAHQTTPLFAAAPPVRRVPRRRA